MNTARESMLHEVRKNLGRLNAPPPPPPVPARIRIPQMPLARRIDLLLEKVAALAGKTLHAKSTAEALAYVAEVISGKTAVASNTPFLKQAGFTALPNVTSGITDEKQLRDLCAVTDFGITSATYALADTGSLVMMAGREEARLVSLLPPVHIAIVPAERILSTIDELYKLEPMPGDSTSSMVLITGPSRTADIEQLLVRGVHGPGEIYVVVVD